MKKFIKRKNYLGPFVGLFTMVSILLATISLGFSHFERVQFKNKLDQERAFADIELKIKHFKNSYSSYEKLLFSISSNKLFQDYLKNKNSKDKRLATENLFFALIKQNSTIMQLRYIDKNGFEKIRFDRMFINSYPEKSPIDQLQNKKDRYYFKDTVKLQKGEVYTSQLDLNIENGQIEIPYKPTLRVAIPVSENDSNNGIIIINIFMENILHEATNSQLFYYYVFDQNNNMIYSNNPQYTNWAKYIKKENISFDFNKQKLLNNKVLLNTNNKETIYLALEVKENIDFFEHFNKVFLILILLILPISFILGYLLSRIPKTLFDNLEKQQEVLIKQSKLAAMGEMIESIAHQWRQPLNAIGVLVQEIKLNHKMGTLDKGMMKTLNKDIQQYLQNMSQTIDNFRCFFNQKCTRDAFDFLECINDAVYIIKPKLDLLKITVNIRMQNNTKETNPYYIIGYKNEVTQSILSLLKNSAESIEKTNKDTKKIDIFLKRDNSMLTVAITDNGTGIDPDIYHRIFEPYFSTKENELQGAGLGLYIVKNIIVGQMKGKIEVTNEIDGSKIELKIPIN